MQRSAVAPYAERLSPIPGPFDLAAHAAWGAIDVRLAALSGIGRHAREIQALALKYAGLSDAALLTEAASLRHRLLRESAALQPVVFALVHVAVERHLGMRYHPVQLAGGRALTGRRIVEMATGEGKTITAILPAAAAALAGRPVHVVTVNDYLAERDSQRLRPVYEALGLTVGLVKQGDEIAARREAYAADVVYVTNKELTFDYLKDRIATAAARGAARHAVSSMFKPSHGGLLLRGLHVAVVDEADSVLIDEARTPLIISAERPNPAMPEVTDRALGIARSLTLGDHYVIDASSRHVRMTPGGQALAAERCVGLPGLFRARFAREQIVAQALSALHMFERDQHYIVEDGKVQIVDEYTGRTMPDRTWEQGLHQLIEAKEGVALTGARETLARITYQRFFNRYHHLSGMTGTAAEVAGELRAVYGVRVVRLPTNRPLLRRDLGGALARDEAAKWEMVADRTATVSAAGRPVLVGTQSVEGSEALSAVLAARGLPHQVLNARQDADEAEVIAGAGQAGRITVATNMAGRGTDIELGPGVAAAGGLHVILTGYHDSTRVDRQLFGRAGRQGDPGSCEAIVALDDELFERFAPRLAGLVERGTLPKAVALRALRWRAQTVASRSNAQIRREQVLSDDRLEKNLGFTGRE
jgi:preprotein translocase subunit SecA